MSSFNTHLDVRHIGIQNFILLSDLIYENSDYIITVSKGFDFDGASIPESLWSIVGCPLGGLYSSPACLHDALYASKIFDRKTCDKLFHEAMLSCGVSQSLAKEMYLAVRVFGQYAYEESNGISKYRDMIKIELKGVE